MKIGPKYTKAPSKKKKPERSLSEICLPLFTDNTVFFKDPFLKAQGKGSMFIVNTWLHIWTPYPKIKDLQMVRKRERTSQLPGISFLSLTFFHDNKGKQANCRRWGFFLKRGGDSRQLPYVKQF